MADGVSTPRKGSMTGLVRGIVNDAQDLIRQQFALLRSEVRSDFQKTKEATLSLAIGAGIAAVGGIILCVMLAHLIQWLWPNVPLWACYGMVGGGLALGGAALIFAGKKKFESFNPLPDQTVQGLKENLQWTTNPR